MSLELDTKSIIDRIFRDPVTRYELTEFEGFSKPVHDILTIYPKVVQSGREAGKTRYFLKSFVPFPSGKTEVQVYAEDGKAAPEEIVRQLWVYKLIHYYGYKPEEIEIEKGVTFGSDVNAKAADIIVYLDASKQTPKIVIECKKPKRKDGIEQLKSYLNAEGSPVGMWSNGADSIILYRPYPKQFDDTLYDIPKRGQDPKDVLEARKTIAHLKATFNFKKIIQDIEELVLADSGADEFNEIFKIIFAKIWDEKEALENRKDKTVEFRKALDPEITYDRINSLFKRACEEWPGIFRDGEDIELRKDHLQVCVGPIEGVRLLGSNLRIMDDAFEYLLPTEAKKKKGQFFTPRHVVEMCVRMLNPKRTEYVMDPACGSGGFLLHAMEWCYPATNHQFREDRKHKYAQKYLWGIDFELRAAKTSRALMLIAGDGHTNIFGPDVSSLDPRTWYATASGQNLIQELRKARLTATPIPANETLRDDDKAWEYFHALKFDVILANPPFAGEMKDKKMLAKYELARRALVRSKDKGAKEERDVLFIERILRWLKPGGRAAIVLPQGKFNNSSLAFIREWILRKARLLAVVGLHPNTFKPHTGTKTSVLFIQKYTDEELDRIDKVKSEVAAACPSYDKDIRALLGAHSDAEDVPEETLPEAVLELLLENFSEPEIDEPEEDRVVEDGEESGEVSLVAEAEVEYGSVADRVAAAEERISDLRAQLLRVKQKLGDLRSDVEALEAKQRQDTEALRATWKGSKGDLKGELKKLAEGCKCAMKSLRDNQKDRAKKLKAEIKVLEERQIPEAERALKLLTTRGKLELVLADEDLVATLKDRWIDAEVAKRLDYPIFMAVSERGGKDNSGEYEHVLDENGNRVEFPEGHPQAGQPVVDQDLVNYFLGPDDLKNASAIPDDQIGIAEAFVRFAQRHHLHFWEAE